MGYNIVNGDITDIEADIIVNASNGIGYMGGKTGLKKKLPGVAEAIHYKTQGTVEKEAKALYKQYKLKHLKLIRGFNPGEIFVTGAGCLTAKYIIHGVTMAFPGKKCEIDTVKRLLPKIYAKAKELGAETIALPILGTGTGGLNSEEVLDIYKEYLSNIDYIHTIVVVYSDK